MPRTKYGATAAQSKRRDEQIAALPPEVRAAVQAMSIDDQEAYLQSLAKADAMAAAGETFTPDLSKNAEKADRPKAKTKGKVGRPAAANPGARTKVKMEPSNSRPVDLAALAEITEFPEDYEPDVPVIYGSVPAGDAVAPAVVLVERELALKAEREAELKAALAKVEETSHGREILSPVFIGRKLIEPDPAEGPLAVAKIVEHEYRVTGDHQEYVLERREEPGGPWGEVSRGYTVGALAFHFGFHRIVAPGLAEATKGFATSYRPARQAFLETLKTKGARTTPISAEERAARAMEIQEDLERQRAANRIRSGGEPADLRWF